MLFLTELYGLKLSWVTDVICGFNFDLEGENDKGEEKVVLFDGTGPDKDASSCLSSSIASSIIRS
jgi:hypothetical protein